MARKKKSTHLGTPALRALNDAGVEYELFEYEHSPVMDHGYALDTSAVLGIEPQYIFKTLLTECDGESVVAVVPASSQLNLKALAKAADAKAASMMDPSKAEKITGYVTGGISPLGQRSTLRTFIDESALELDMILVSGGKRNLSVRLGAQDLAEAINAQFAIIQTGQNRKSTALN
ncbi:Cys-tRNA(Pro) deacylase [Arcanobacterium ihumii]|uniref:Cys-tRNA(Pro) deacylase n=1 Tax=Arcanobacterium ihumii TaxID=2138162 RepID=UPI000F532A54|nr:Cys-tRNA(Pro) deacylase [Arcanobacterium ihumii]